MPRNHLALIRRKSLLTKQIGILLPLRNRHLIGLRRRVVDCLKQGLIGHHRTPYKLAMSEMKPTYGHWVIFEHCMPFNVSRAYDEAGGLDHPKIWTAERDLEMWRALEGAQPVKSAEVHS